MRLRVRHLGGRGAVFPYPSLLPPSLSLSLIAPAIFRPRFRRVYVYVYVSDLVGDHHQEGKERKGANLCLSGTRSLE